MAWLVFMFAETQCVKFVWTRAINYLNNIGVFPLAHSLIE